MSDAPLRVGIRYDLRAAPGGASHEALSRAAIEQCAAVDGQGVDHVQLSEHHGSDDGYCPSPLVLGAAVAAVTRQLDLLFAAVVLPLHDPIRVAEDVAVLDQISGGRVHLGCVAGYCEPEFALFGVPYGDRARRLEAGVAQLRLAWTGEPFRHRHTTVSVHPRPARAGGPPVYLGGRGPKAALRAARLGDGMLCGTTDVTVAEIYLAERERLGRSPGLFRRPGASSSVFVTDDPDEAWAVVGPHALQETRSYAAWAGGRPTNAFVDASAVDELRAQGSYAFVTPEQCIELHATLGPHDRLVLHPLVGGLDPDIGWRSVELFTTKVAPAIRAGAGAP